MFARENRITTARKHKGIQCLLALTVTALLAIACGTRDAGPQITILNDNTSFDSRLLDQWGFAALIEYGNESLLFDTGQTGRVLLSNMEVLEIDPASIEKVAISHFHNDHTGGLESLMKNGMEPTVYVLPSFSDLMKLKLSSLSEDIVEVDPGQELAEGIFTTGEMQGVFEGHSIAEQAVVVSTDGGLVVITGCAHPGIVEIVAHAKEMFGAPIRLVMGGFHMLDQSEAEIQAVINDFRSLGVEQVSPTHCTGEQAIAMFAGEYGDDYIEGGVGRAITIGP